MADNPSFPRRHKRSIAVQRARQEIDSHISDTANEYKLTYGEIFSILSEIMLSHTKYMIRQERHGDSSTPGDLE